MCIIISFRAMVCRSQAGHLRKLHTIEAISHSPTVHFVLNRIMLELPRASSFLHRVVFSLTQPEILAQGKCRCNFE